MITLTTAAKAAFGVILSRNGNVIAELTNIGSPKLSLDTVEATSHQSADGYKEYIGTLLDGGEVAIEGNFIADDTDGQIGLISDMNNKTLQSFVITFPASITATWTFNALVTAFEIGDMAVDGTLTFSATLKVSGKPTLAIGASNNLTNLVLTTATLYPTFAADTYDYVADSVGNNLTVTPTFAAGTCTVTANGASQTVASGAASGAIDLGADGSMTVITIKVQEAGKVAKTYTVRVANEAA
jgi:hypothetical protein